MPEKNDLPELSEDQRLRAFRDQNRQAARYDSRRGLFYGVLIGLAGALVVAAVALPYLLASKSSGINVGMSAEQWRDYAAYLADKKLSDEAIAAYGTYLDKASLAPDARAKVCYAVADLAMEAERYTEALVYLYQAELVDPATSLKSEIDKKVVLCLEKTGRSTDLRRELRKRTSPKRTAADVQTGETIVAEFAGEVLTDRDLEKAIDKYPASLRDAISTPEQKADFLKNLVAERLLVDKALRQELEKDPEVERQLAEQRDALVVHKLIENEVQAKVLITPEDVERYYHAEIKRFTQAAQAEVRVAKADTFEAAKTLSSFPDPPVRVEDGGAIPGVGTNAEAVHAIFAADPGQATAPAQVGSAWYAFQVVSKTPEQVRPFGEVKALAEKMLHEQKQQEQIKLLIEDTLKARDVRLYPERLKKDAPSK